MLSVLRSIFPSQHLWNYLNYGRSNFVRKFTQKNAIKWWFPAWFVSRVTWESQNTRVYITCNHECFMLFLRWTCNTFLLSLFVLLRYIICSYYLYSDGPQVYVPSLVILLTPTTHLSFPFVWFIVSQIQYVLNSWFSTSP